MFCKNCGAKIKEGGQFCPKCGSRIEESQSVEKKVVSLQEKVVGKQLSVAAILQNKKVIFGAVIGIVAVVLFSVFFPKVRYEYHEDGTATVVDWIGIPRNWMDIDARRLSRQIPIIKVTIPSKVRHGFRTYSVTSIGDEAFDSWNGLKRIEIPDSVTSIGYEAFNSCRGLKSIELGDGVTSIGNRAFANCVSLKRIEIPDSVTSIGYGAFTYSALESIELGNSVTSIGDGAFDSCYRLKSIEIPDSVTSIGYGAFTYGLESIIFRGNTMSVSDFYENYNYLFKAEK